MKNFRRIILSIPLLFYLGILSPIIGQNPERNKIYKIWIETMDNRMIKGFFVDIDSTGISVAGTLKNLEADTYFVNAENIRIIKLRRKGKVSKSAGYGALVGAAFGAIVGFADGDDPPCEATGLFDCLFYVQNTAGEKAAGGAIALGIVGGGIGAITGTGRRKMEVNGNLSMYYLKIPIIKEYTGRISVAPGRG